MKYNLWLDDLRNPNDIAPNTQMVHTWKSLFFTSINLPLIWVKTYEEFCFIIHSRGLPEQISFDNDLGEVMEGKDCAKWLFNYIIENNLKMPKISIQSANPICAKEIYNILVNDYEKYLFQKNL